MMGVDVLGGMVVVEGPTASVVINHGCDIMLAALAHHHVWLFGDVVVRTSDL